MASMDQELGSQNKGRFWAQRGRPSWNPHQRAESKRAHTSSMRPVFRDITLKGRRLES